MSDLSRRDLLRASAGAAVVAVPMAALGSSAVAAATRFQDAAGVAPELSGVEGPVMFCVHDARRGEVSILHGTSEVVVQDRQLVDRVLRAAAGRH